MANQSLILVDKNDEPRGTLEKLEVHRQGLLHRAFSIFIFNTKGELLLQQRADDKYHSGGLWSNTCCSHPKFGEDIKVSISKRLNEEMGLVCETTFAFSFVYKAELQNGLIEHEYDHVYFGTSDVTPKANTAEVKNWKYVGIEDLAEEIKNYPESFTEWMKICLPRVAESLNTAFMEKKANKA